MTTSKTKMDLGCRDQAVLQRSAVSIVHAPLSRPFEGWGKVHHNDKSEMKARARLHLMQYSN